MRTMHIVMYHRSCIPGWTNNFGIRPAQFFTKWFQKRDVYYIIAGSNVEESLETYSSDFCHLSILNLAHSVTLLCVISIYLRHLRFFSCHTFIVPMILVLFQYIERYVRTTCFAAFKEGEREREREIKTPTGSSQLLYCSLSLLLDSRW
jgi:hypothetical protein